MSRTEPAAESGEGSEDGEAGHAPTREATGALLARAHRVLHAGDDPAAVASLSRELREAIAGGRRSAATQKLKAMLCLAKWRRTGELVPNYRNLMEARVQLWEYELRCPVLPFQKAFVAGVSRDFPDAAFPAQLSRLYDLVEEPVADQFDDMDRDVVVLRRPGAEMTILCFSGMRGQLTGMSWTMFDRIVGARLNADLVILRDRNSRFYLRGVESLGGLDESLAKLKALLSEFADRPIVAAGGSSGVFGALYISARLGLEHVVAFSGPTSLDIGVDEGDRQKYLLLKQEAEQGLAPYPDLAEEVAASSIRRIDFFVAGLHEFDMRQMRHLEARCPAVKPHVFENESNHSTVNNAVLDGSIYDAFRAQL